MTENPGSSDDPHPRVNDLNDKVDQKIRVLVAEMHASGWATEEILLAINDVVKMRWLDRLHSQNAVGPTMTENFISDGNEG